MNFSSLLSREIIRPLTTLVAPGAVALAPYLFLLMRYHASIRRLAVRDSVTLVLVVLIAALAVGLVLEDLGSWIESERWDTRLRAHHPDRERIWWHYLALSYSVEIEPVGQHAIRSVLLGMKFELALALGLLIATPGLIVWGLITNGLPWFMTAVLLILVAALSTYLIRESFHSAETLADMREVLVDGPDNLLRRLREQAESETRGSS